MSASNPSLCIPRAFVNTDEKLVLSVFNQLNLGEISHIDIVQRKNERGEPYKRVFIHFAHWFNNRDAITARSKILEGKELKIVYDGPWFWKVSLNRYHTATQPSAFKPHIEWNDKPHIDWSDDKPKTMPVAPRHLPPQPPQKQHYNPRPNKAINSQAYHPQAYHPTVAALPAHQMEKSVPIVAAIPTKKVPNKPNKYNKQQKASVTDQSAALPVKKRVLTKKVKGEVKSVAESVATEIAAKKQVVFELEDGEVNELVVELTADDQQLAEALYGDI
jgi:hypothetical protein